LDAEKLNIEYGNKLNNTFLVDTGAGAYWS